MLFDVLRECRDTTREDIIIGAMLLIVSTTRNAPRRNRTHANDCSLLEAQAIA